MPAPAPAAAPAPAMARSWSVLTEPPHAHIVCRACGRIAPFPLDTESELRLERLATRRPEGWSVELISFSVTGACARCRMGLSPTE
jgi:Fe2+ or Zn2+ uptake regulation protein